MIDPILSLIFSFVNNKGTYALLLGSGISRPSGIPTGWEIVLDLIQKLAKLQNEKIESNPEEWFVNKYNSEPNYSELLNSVFKTHSERNNFLKQYFEPTESEIEQGLKVPTKAHTAIAKLVKDGFIKVIITTNFDRLLEIALEEENVIPNVISTIDNLKGSQPLIHSKCTIVKINGDYLDTRIRNTVDELEEYEKEFNDLLEKILDDFGLIISGWSADWDLALYKSIEKCKSRRYTTYWTFKDGVTDNAQKLIRLRSAEVINNTTADNFFSELLEKTLSIGEIERPHPISSQIAIVTTKKYLSNSSYNINLHDLIIAETKKVRNILLDKTLFSTDENFSEQDFLKRISTYESKLEILMNIIITVSYWGKSDHEKFISKCLDTIVNSNSIEGGLVVYINIKKYPSLLLMYAAGISAIASNNYRLLKILLTDIIVTFENPHVPIIQKSLTDDVMEKGVAAMLPGRNPQNFTPFSDYLAEFFRPYFQDYILEDKIFFKLFDRFEYTLALIHAGIQEYPNDRFWTPVGSFGWRGRRYNSENTISKIIDKELNKLKTHHPLLGLGLFDNSLDKLFEVKSKVDKFVSELRWG